jgi:hypothetical protein
MTRDQLDQTLLRAHETRDGTALAHLYTHAADHSPNTDEQAFFLTQAYIFALEVGDPTAQALETRLRHLGRV